jgi:hypothetical protein
MSKENITGTIVEVSLDQILSELLSEYVTNLRKDGQKIFAIGEEFTSSVDIQKYKAEINDIFTDDNLRLNADKNTLKEYIVILESVAVTQKCDNALEIEKLRKAVDFCIRILKRNVI